MASPTKETKKLLESEGYLVDVAEYSMRHSNRNRDLFGFIDLVGIKEGDLVAIQTTSRSNTSKRINKVAESPAARIWLLSGNRIEVHGWGGRSGLKRVEVTMDYMESQE